MFSARQRGDGLCGPCSRKANDDPDAPSPIDSDAPASVHGWVRVCRCSGSSSAELVAMSAQHPDRVVEIVAIVAMLIAFVVGILVIP